MKKAVGHGSDSLFGIGSTDYYLVLLSILLCLFAYSSTAFCLILRAFLLIPAYLLGLGGRWRVACRGSLPVRAYARGGCIRGWCVWRH